MLHDTWHGKIGKRVERIGARAQKCHVGKDHWRGGVGEKVELWLAHLSTEIPS